MGVNSTDTDPASVEDTVASAEYEDILNNVDLEYVLLGTELKENITLKSANVPSQLSFQLTTTSSLFAKESEGEIYFVNADGETVFQMSEAIMYDAKGAESTDIKVKLTTISETEESNQYKLTVTPSADWLKDENRVYPVVLDPTITTTQTAAAIYDTHVNSDSPSTNYGSSTSMVVGTNSSGKSRAYIKFTLPTQIHKSDRIVSAELGLYTNTSNSYSIFSGSQISAAPTLYMFAPSSDWSESSLTWNNQPAYSSLETVDYNKINIVNGVAETGWYTWDVTSMVDKWYNGEPNYGIMIKDTESTKYSKRAYYYSSDLSGASSVYPIINISYLNMIGLEDYWTYHTQSAGLAGTGYVNDFTGGLTTSFEDYSWDSELLSLSVSHVYSSYYADDVQPSLNVGKGFMLSLQERLFYVNINGTYLYRYYDSDGTQHYFQYSDSKWTDDSGLGLTLTMPGDGHLYVTDKEDNVRMFNSSTGYLEEIKDNDGNKITLSYSSGGYLANAYDDAGHMLSFNRDGNNRLSYISVKNSADPYTPIAQIFYTYDSTGHLTQVKFPGKSNVSSSGGSGADNIAVFGYTASGSLNSMGDTTNGMRVDYTYADWYNSNQNRRIDGFEVYDASGNIESSYTMSYSPHCTRFTEVTPDLGRNQVYVFNYMGQTISAQDQDGNALFCETGLSGGAKNKVTFSSKAQQTITNLLKNHDFEDGTSYFGTIGNASFSIDSSHAFSGNNCFKVTTSTASSGYCVVLQGAEAKGGQSYTLSAYIKTEGCTTNGACLRLVALDGNGNMVTAARDTDNIISENSYMRFETSIDLSDYSSSNTYSLYMYIGLKDVNYTATAHIDSVQLEAGECANRYNLLENGDLEDGTNNWVIEGNSSSDGLVTDSTLTHNQTGTSYRFYGSATVSKKLYQTVAVNGDAGDSYVFGCWLISTGLPNKDTGDGTKQCVGMTLKFANTDGTSTYKNVLITPTAEEWQYICASAVAAKSYSSVTIYLKYVYNRNYVIFDDVQLYKDSFGDSFTYDSNGNVISVVDKAKNTASAAVNGNNDTTSYSDGKGQTYTFQYDNGSTTDKNHNLTRSTAPDGTYSTFTFNDQGNVTATHQYGNAGTRNISSTVTYTTDGAYKTASTDQRELQTTYDYDSVYGLLDSTTIPVGLDTTDTLTTTNTYDSDTRKLTQIGSSFIDDTLQYYYEENRPSSIQVGDASTYQKYDYDYDDAGNMTSISHSSSGNTTPSILESYTYLDGRGIMSAQSYANGQTLNYTYDDQDRLIGVSDGSNQISEYVYDSNGLLAKSYSYGENSFVTINQYDLADRLISTYNSNGSGIYNVGYDKNNLATGYNSYLRDGSANLEYTTEYDYNECLNSTVENGVDKPKSSTLKAGSTTLTSTSLGYDAYGRLSITLATAGNTNVSHVKVGYVYMNVGTDKTTTMLGNLGIRYSTVPDSEEAADIRYYPTYDRAGNITDIQTVLKNGTSSTSSYTYDSLSRLTSATNVADTGDDYAYTYDDRNNITGSTVTNNGTTTQTKTYTYATDDIDRLTSFSHTTASGTVTRNYTCDSVGNPTAIVETDSSDNSTRNFTLSWTQGKLLSTITDGSTLNNTYCYNADGNISKKTLADGSYVIYHYSDSTLEYEEHFNSSSVLQEVLKYSYDADGNVEYLLYKDDNFSNANAYDLYYYVRNVTGDITYLFQVREQNGSSTTEVNRLVAHYEYDPYGNILSIDTYNNDNIGNINPIRYKDYYYDAETGWYQAGSRFYDPEVGRFLNADDLSLITETASNVIDKNLYAYCDGNPVMRKDNGGECWNIIAGAVVGAAIGVAVEIISNKIAGEKTTFSGALIAAGTGAVTGAAAASGLGLVSMVGLSTVSSMVGEGAKQGMKGEFSAGGLLMSGAGGAISGLVGGKGMGTYANLKTLNKNLTRKLFSGSLQTFKKGLKYYASQTRKVYRRRLLTPLKHSGLASLICNGWKSLYYRWRH